MKRFYLDTNVFLARYASTEKEHNSSTRLLDALERGWIRAITSPLTLIEVASMVRRSHEKSGEKIRPSGSSGRFCEENPLAQESRVCPDGWRHDPERIYASRKDPFAKEQSV